MASKMKQPDAAVSVAGRKWFAQLGTGLTIAGGLSFLFLCMILPLVGKAGVQTVHYRENFFAFLAVLLLSLLLSSAATAAKLMRRRIDRSPLPWMSIALTALCVLLLVSLVTGLLHI
jgi:hypothetical protein